jgi:Membrane protein involved in the export of O-antigen and teichoic acid
LKLAHHTFFNLIGLGAPLLVALASIPALMHGLGVERFGLLTLIWAVTSYFGLFDLGVGRALTQQLAIALNQRAHNQIGPLCATALALMAAFGVLGGLVLASLAPWGVDLINNLSDRSEAVTATLMMGLAMPAIVLTAGLRGMLEAKHEFGLINLIRLPMGIWTFVGPWLVVYYKGADLVWIAAALALGRWVAMLAHALLVRRVFTALGSQWTFQAKLLRPLCVSGGWLTAGNIIGSLLAYADRFIIGAVVSAAAVTYYTTPQELVTKLSILPGALTAVLFPTFAVQTAQRDEAALRLCKDMLRWLMLVMLPLTLALALFAQELLGLWLGAEFAPQGGRPLQIFAAGMLISSLAQVPFTVIQSAGRAKVTALIHAVQVPLFLFALVWAATQYGIEGAAWAWLARGAVDALAMAWAAGKVLDDEHHALLSWPTWLALGGCGLAFAGLLLPSTLERGLWLALVGALVGAAMLRQLQLSKRVHGAT